MAHFARLAFLLAVLAGAFGLLWSQGRIGGPPDAARSAILDMNAFPYAGFALSDDSALKIDGGSGRVRRFDRTAEPQAFSLVHVVVSPGAAGIYAQLLGEQKGLPLGVFQLGDGAVVYEEPAEVPVTSVIVLSGDTVAWIVFGMRGDREERAAMALQIAQEQVSRIERLRTSAK